MKCADPILCYTDSNGKRRFRHFTLANPDFKKFAQQVFSCGKCLFCRKKKSYELASRCVLHASLYDKNCFLTLTYDEKKQGYNNELRYSDIQKFKKRLRQECIRKENKKIEIFNVHEYGRNGKKHWHLIIFNHDFDDKIIFTRKNSIPLYTSKTLERLWPFGFNTIGDVTEASAMYQAQYMEKDIRLNYSFSKKKSKSNHSGIGRAYFQKHFRDILRLGYIPINGQKLPVPRYFQRLAHKHYCHFYDKGEFFDSPITGRKRLYTPFKSGEASHDIANHYIIFKALKDEKIKELEAAWEDVILHHLTTNETPDFIKSHDNSVHDLRNKNTIEKF